MTARSRREQPVRAGELNLIHTVSQDVLESRHVCFVVCLIHDNRRQLQTAGRCSSAMSARSRSRPRGGCMLVSRCENLLIYSCLAHTSAAANVCYLRPMQPTRARAPTGRQRGRRGPEHTATTQLCGMLIFVWALQIAQSAQAHHVRQPDLLRWWRGRAAQCSCRATINSNLSSMRLRYGRVRWRGRCGSHNALKLIRRPKECESRP